MNEKGSAMNKIRYEVYAKYRLSLWNKIDHIEWENKLDDIAHKYGGEEYGTGTDFAIRDLHYGGFKSHESASRFASRLKRFKAIISTDVVLSDVND